MSNKRSKQLSEDEFSDEFFSDDDEDSYAPESEDEGSSGSESDIESARPASPFSPLVKIRGVNEKEFNARNRGLAADDFAVKKKLFERGYKSDAGSDEDDTIQDFIEESKPRKSAAIKSKAPKQTTARKSKTDYSDDESEEYEVADDNSTSEDEEDSRSQAESDADADDLTSRMASMKLAAKSKTATSKPVDAKKSSSQSKASKPVDSDDDSEDDKENDKHHGNANRVGKSKKDELVVKKETKKVESLPEPKRPMNAYAIYVKARTPALKMKHPHSNGTTIKELINSEWADLDLKTKEIYQKKAKEDKRRYESEKLDWQNQQKKLKL